MAPETLGLVPLSSFRLSETGDLARKMPAPPHKRTKGYERAFDAHTLIYDCFWDPDRSEVVLVCPRLLNLWPTLRDGLSVNGSPAGRRLHRKTHLRLEVLRLKQTDRPEQLEMTVAGKTTALPVLSRDHETFAGRNVLLAISKDNPIEWIEDWARYHSTAHGADAVLLFDNGSTDYSPDEVQSRLVALPGIAICRVISAPFPYGGPGGGRLNVPAKFFQTSMFNIAQLRFLQDARAVLSVDIDELVWPAGSVFDAAVQSAFGMVSFFGHWVYPPAPGLSQPQRAHAMRKGRRMIPNPKWCIVPDSLAGRHSWAVHRPAGLFYPLSIRRKFGFWHCFATSTNWKHSRTKTVDGLEPCPALVDAIKRYLPPAD